MENTIFQTYKILKFRKKSLYHFNSYFLFDSHMNGMYQIKTSPNCLFVNDSSRESKDIFESPASFQLFDMKSNCSLNLSNLDQSHKLQISMSPQNGNVSSEYHINKYRSLMQKSKFDQEIFNLALKTVNKNQAPLKNLTKNNVIFQNDSKNFFSQDKKGFQPSRRKFTDKEDIILKSAVKIFGTSNWKIIASMVPGRTPRQCRDRYTNYLAPGLVRLEWSEEEDKLLAEKYIMFGPQWTKIRQYFPTRSANDIKNRYNYTVCRKVQEVQRTSSVLKKNCEESISETDAIFNLGNENGADIFKIDFIDTEDIFCQPCFVYGNEDF